MDNQSYKRHDSDPFYRNWTELIYPERVEIDHETLTEFFGKLDRKSVV